MIAATSAKPRLSIVTPAFNSRRFIDAAIGSVISQGYPDLEYIVMDGGSSDGTVDIIQSYGDHLSHWESSRDAGQYDALNKGFALSTGEIMGWLNSDDLYLPWTFTVVAEIFSRFPEINWISSLSPLIFDEEGSAVWSTRVKGFDRASFFAGANLPGHKWFATSWIQQESTFWRRTLWEKAGARLDIALDLAADFELWARFFQHDHLYGVGSPLGGFRRHNDQKTAHHLNRYQDEAVEALRKHGGTPPGRLASEFRGRISQMPVPLKRAFRVPRTMRNCEHGGPGVGWQIVES